MRNLSLVVKRLLRHIVNISHLHPFSERSLVRSFGWLVDCWANFSRQIQSLIHFLPVAFQLDPLPPAHRQELFCVGELRVSVYRRVLSQVGTSTLEEQRYRERSLLFRMSWTLPSSQNQNAYKVVLTNLFRTCMCCVWAVVSKVHTQSSRGSYTHRWLQAIAFPQCMRWLVSVSDTYLVIGQVKYTMKPDF